MLKQYDCAFACIGAERHSLPPTDGTGTGLAPGDKK